MEFLLLDIMSKPLWIWLVFIIFVFALLIFDLGVLHRRSHVIEMRESLLLSSFYVAIGLAFSIWIWHLMGEKSAFDYLTGFVVEKSLAMDNVFVMATIFSYFAVPREYQHRVLIYGILGVIVLRGVMIGAGSVVITQFEWVLYIFAAFLVLTGIKMLFMAEMTYDVGSNPVLKWLRRHIRITDRFHGERFVVRLPDKRAGRTALYATPLLLALVMIEIADVIFAVDSIPAIFAITQDPYIVYTSNIFAILGLRALYFLLASVIHRFVYLKHALSLVLIFIGAKVFVAELFGLAKIPPVWSLSITLAILVGGIVLSLWRTRHEVAVTTDVALPLSEKQIS